MYFKNILPFLIFNFLLIDGLKKSSPAFKWMSTSSEHGVPLLNIKFPNNVDNDFAVLKIVDVGSNDDPGCTLEGVLMFEKSATVKITKDCEVENTFEIEIKSQNLLYTFFNVTNGKVEPVIAAEEQPSDRDFEEQEPLEIPENPLILKLIAFYDSSFQSKFKSASKTIVETIVKEAQTLFSLPSLKFNILLELTDVKETTDTEPSTIIQLSSENTEEDNNAFLVFTASSPVEFSIETRDEFICSYDPEKRIVFVNWDKNVKKTSKVFAQEVGLLLGMEYDFKIDPTTSKIKSRSDSKKQVCTNINGIMDFNSEQTVWSSCSVENFLIYYHNYKKEQDGGEFCLKENSTKFEIIQGNILLGDVKLYPNQRLQSPNGSYYLSLSPEGLLAIYNQNNDEKLWTASVNSGDTTFAEMQRDGNFIMYAGDNTNPRWATNTEGNTGAYLAMEDDANLVVYSKGGKKLWMSNTILGHVMRPEIRYYPGPILKSPHGYFTLSLSSDGILRLHSATGEKIWEPSVRDDGKKYVIMQDDGNFVMYNQNGQPKWATGTHNNEGSYFTLQDDGNLVVYSDRDRALWSSQTEFKDKSPITVLEIGMTVYSDNKEYFLLMQSDNNLALRKTSNNQSVWVTDTSESFVSYPPKAIFQADGNLVLVNSYGSSYWRTNTGGNPGAAMKVLDSGSLAILAYDNRSLWNSADPPTKTTTAATTIYLVGGNRLNKGNVFAINPTTGTDGPVCDDDWSLEAANVVCRQLGFSGALSYTVASNFGNVPNYFSYDNVMCTGKEATLNECPHNDSDNCDEGEGAGVICNTDTTTQSTETNSTNSVMPVHSVTLVGGSSPNEGYVFATNPTTGKYGPVCDDEWTIKAANVVCKQLGFSGALSFTANSFFGSVTGDFDDISYDDVKCSGNEATINECPHSDNSNCDLEEVVGVTCNTEASTANTIVHSVNLVGGSSPNEGNVFATNPTTGQHGPVCDDDWTLEAANVVCKQLGFSGALDFTTGSNFGSVKDSFSYDDVKCDGTEATLNDCPHSDSDNCGKEESAGVICKTAGTTEISTVEHSVSLVGGNSSNQGNVVATNPTTGIKGPICDYGWSLEAADIVCRQLGFPGALNHSVSSYFGNVQYPFSYYDLQCVGNEDNLNECQHSNSDHHCGENEGAGVICNTNNTTQSTEIHSIVHSVKLQGGSSPNEGNVFATNPTSGNEGPVCDDEWSLEAAKVVCRQLGFSGALKHTVSSHFGNVPDSFSYDDVICDGTEDTLNECQHSNSDNCAVEEGAGVICNTDEEETETETEYSNDSDYTSFGGDEEETESEYDDDDEYEDDSETEYYNDTESSNSAPVKKLNCDDDDDDDECSAGSGDGQVRK